jgi:hypothetical protein
LECVGVLHAAQPTVRSTAAWPGGSVATCCTVLQRVAAAPAARHFLSRVLCALLITALPLLRAAPQRVEELQQQKAYMVQWEREGLLEHAKNLTKRRSQVKAPAAVAYDSSTGLGRAECCSTPRGCSSALRTVPVTAYGRAAAGEGGPAARARVPSQGVAHQADPGECVPQYSLPAPREGGREGVPTVRSSTTQPSPVVEARSGPDRSRLCRRTRLR